ncbi:MAG: FAD-dependent oxidoreductase [Spirochaetaceae bacterium]|nr:MAG: FAD-dependent oxidoreductase [Spirochaetaceae bacterium]
MSSNKSKTYDFIVIGSGPGGYVAAIRAAQLGLATALVEKNDSFGGTCLNIGCIPSKALLDSSELYARLRASGKSGKGGISAGGHDLGAHGIRVGKLDLDLKAMMARKQQVVEKLTSGVGQLLKGNGVETFRGVGRLVAQGKVEVSDGEGKKQILSAKNIVLATGSVPVELPIFPAGKDGFLTSTEALSLKGIPSRMVVIGAGAIGLELGSVWSRLGAEVTVIELLDQILPGMDSEISRRLRSILAKQGLRIVTGSRVQGYERAGKGVSSAAGKSVAGKAGRSTATKSKSGSSGSAGVVLSAEEADGKKQSYPADVVLVAVGRRPYTEGLGLAELGIRTEERSGRVLVDKRFQTSLPGVYAIGDLIPGPMLAHKAEEEGMALAELLAGKAGEVNYDTIPSVVYTWPEVASVGMSEDALKREGVEYNKGTFPFRANGRALAMASEDGLVKVLADRRTDRLLGVHIVGPWASDLIAEAVTVMEFGGSAEDIARTVHAHPTLPEALREAALDLDGRAIHTLSRKKV